MNRAPRPHPGRDAEAPDAPDALTWTVDPGLLYGRPGPAKSAWNLPHLHRRGIRAIVSLVPVERPQDIRAAGMAWYSIAFEEKLHTPWATSNDFLFPILAEFDRILDAHLPRGEAVLVHCNSGKDRTGLLLAYYLVRRKGLSARKALKRVREARPDALTASGYEDLLFAFERRFRGPPSGIHE